MPLMPFAHGKAGRCVKNAFSIFTLTHGMAESHQILTVAKHSYVQIGTWKSLTLAVLTKNTILVLLVKLKDFTLLRATIS